MRLILTYFESVHDAKAKGADATFSDYAETLQFASTITLPRAAKEDTLCIVPAKFDPPRRGSANVVARYAFTGDVDGDKPGDPGFEGMAELLRQLGFSFILHTTTKSTVTTNRYRVVLPFSEPLSREDYGRVCSSIDQMLGGIFDTKTFDAGRLSIVPAQWHGCPDNVAPEDWDESLGHHAFVAVTDGDLLDAQVIMEAFPPFVRSDVADDEATRAFLEAHAASVTDYDWFELTTLDRSPLIRPEFIDAYLSSPRGGRFYKFMVSVAGRALHRGLPCTPEVVLALALEVSRRGGDRQRPNGLHEANNAIRYAAARQAAPDFSASSLSTKQQRLEKEVARLSRYY